MSERSTSSLVRRPPLIAVDGRSLNRLHVRGIGRYVNQIIRLSLQRGDLRWLVLADRPDLPLHVPAHPDVRTRLFDTRGHRFYAWEQLVAPWRAWAAGAQTLWWPATTAARWQPTRAAVTIHDAIPWTGEDGMFPPGLYRDSVLPSAYAHAAAIMTPSAASAADLANRWPLLSRKLHVVPHGIEEAYLRVAPGPMPECLVHSGVRQPYLLYLGGEIPRKRPDWAIDVWSSLDDQVVDLVVCGANPPAHPALRAKVRPELQSRVHFLSFVSEDQMPQMYVNAAAVLYPSLYEGFGFPVLEAQACGTPVLFSPVGSLAELIGPSARVLPPEDKSAWVENCRAILKIPIEARTDEARRSRDWATNHSWRRSYEAHLSILSDPAAGTESGA